MMAWLEITDRKDVGVNLKAPALGKGDVPHWSYDLVRQIPIGDVVFHYDTRHGAIVGSSVIVGQPWQDDIVWAARGTASRQAGIAPHVQLGWYRALQGFSSVEPPLTRDDVFARWKEVDAVRAALPSDAAKRFPFILYGGREVRAFQAYLTAFPDGLLNRFPRLRRDTGQGQAGQPALRRQAYREADEEGSVAARHPFAVDPIAVERSTRAHARIQNSLARFVTERGATPVSPLLHEPDFDVGWEHAGVFFVAEVKSLTKDNEEQQLRLGLGQVLRYRQSLAKIRATAIKAILAVEREPRDPAWELLCQELDVLLICPPFKALVPLLAV